MPALDASVTACASPAGSVMTITSGSIYLSYAGFVSVPGIKRPTFAWAPIFFAKTLAGYWPYWRADIMSIFDGSYLASIFAAALMRSSVYLISSTYKPSVRTR